jgi:hypothetical protein
VVVTVREAAAVLPKPCVFSTIVDPELLVTVPIAPAANPLKPPPPRPMPPGAPVGRVVGLVVGAPDGRTPPAPRPAKPNRAAQVDVPVTVTIAAVTAAVEDGDGGVDDDLERRPPELIVTQSPTATEERDPVATLVNRVDDAHATTVVPELVATLTPELDTAVALPDAAVKPPRPPREPDGAAAAVFAAPLADPQPATTRAVSASPAAGSTL